MGYSVLAVDDSATVRAIIAKTLKLAGVDVSFFHEAPDGREALRVLKETWVDLVFSDLNMPGMSGYELVEEMRRDGLLATVPVVVVSSVGAAEAIETLKAKGIRDYLRKPFKPEDIRRVVQTVMGGAHARPA